MRLLTEIRDLQRQHAESYKQALENQRESLEFNRAWGRRARQGQILGLILVFAVVTAMWVVILTNK